MSDMLKNDAMSAPIEKRPAHDAIHVENVNIFRKKHPVLKNISLNVPQGHVVGLVGLNGAGKTTFIKAILGLLSEVEGRIEIFGTSFDRCEARETLSYLPEQFRPPGQLSGITYLRLMRKFEKNCPDTQDIVEMCRSLDLDSAALKKKIRTYSKGMGQKLGLALTFASNASLLILDEPMSGLDPRARSLLKRQIIQARSQGRSILVSSHILADLDEFADQIVIIHQGHLIASGTVDKIKNNHDTLEQAFLAHIEAAEKNAQSPNGQCQLSPALT